MLNNLTTLATYNDPILSRRIHSNYAGGSDICYFYWMSNSPYKQA
ncbi:hypothetical protein PEC301619_01410 [Pectobacterium carotovorum subsp. carotovorum]|nr:hypothetical protein PEC301619_01410 [Pectobacterium carotovorum subsp. carotovorum]GKW06848.1 hypothetical protein PEC301889_13310 [Pectobacterium carotovorum subsp. carotovorum]